MLPPTAQVSAERGSIISTSQQSTMVFQQRHDNGSETFRDRPDDVGHVGATNSQVHNKKKEGTGVRRRWRQAGRLEDRYNGVFSSYCSSFGFLCAAGFAYLTYRHLYVPMEGAKSMEPTRTRNAFCDRGALPYICAHGGDSTSYLPNTAAAYTAAVAVTDCVEIDVSLTADQELVALHDKDLQQRLQTPDARVEQYTLAELQVQQATSPEGSVLTVARALQLTAPHVKRVILDVKTQDNKMLLLPDGTTQSKHAFVAEQLLAVLDALGYKDALIWAKSDSFIAQIKLRAPDQLSGYTVMRASGAADDPYMDPSRQSAADIEVAAVYHGLLNDELMGALKARNKSVYAWTADDLSEVHRLVELGIDGIVTNNPAEVADALKQRMLECHAQPL